MTTSAKQKLIKAKKTIYQAYCFLYNKLKKLQITRQHNTAKNNRKLPCYLLIGQPDTHQALLAHSEQAFTQQTLPIEHPHWISEQALWINISTETDSDAQQNLIKYLKKRQWRRPIQGIVITSSIDYLLKVNSGSNNNAISEITNLLKNYLDILKMELPLYCVFTDCAQLPGFLAFFNDLSQEELSQVWGITINQQDLSCQNIADILNQYYPNLVQPLESQLLDKLDRTKSIEERESLFNFPQQVASLKTLLINYCQQITNHSITIRGCYYTQFTSEKSYFVPCLFQQVILADKNKLAQRQIIKKSKYSSKKIAVISIPLLSLWISIALIIDYNKQSANNNITQQQLSTVKPISSSQNKLNTQDLQQNLQTLDTLQKQSQKLSWLQYTLWPSLQLETTSIAAFQRSITTQLLPRLFLKIQRELTQDSSNIENKYANLLIYLNLSAFYSHNTDLLAFAVKQLFTQPMQDYLLFALVNHNFAGLPPDRTLIKATKIQLNTINPAEYAYQLLLNHRNNRGEKYIIAINIPKQYQLPNLLNIDLANYRIHFLYTHDGLAYYAKFFSKQAAHRAAAVNRYIGLKKLTQRKPQYILDDVHHMYLKHYQAAWWNLLTSIKFQACDNLKCLAKRFSILQHKTSAFENILYQLKANTQNLPWIGYKITESFSTIDKFNTTPILKIFAELGKIFNQIDHSENSNYAAFKLLKQFKKSSNTPLYQLKNSIKQAPYPINHWLQSLASNCWELLQTDALRYINQQWQQVVLPIYQQSIANHYPIDSTSKAILALKNFNQFFALNGILQSFYQNYITPLPGKIFAHSQSYQELKNALQVSHCFFTSNHPEHAVLNLTIQTHDLSADTKQLSWQWGNQTLINQHGPVAKFTVSWPLATKNSQCYLQQTSFNQASKKIGGTGLWSFFKILQKGQLQAQPHTINKNYYLFTTVLNQQAASFILNITQNSSKNSSCLLLTHLRHLKLPDHF